MDGPVERLLAFDQRASKVRLGCRKDNFGHKSINDAVEDEDATKLLARDYLSPTVDSSDSGKCLGFVAIWELTCRLCQTYCLASGPAQTKI